MAFANCGSDAFDESCPAKEPKDIALAFKDRLKGMSVEVNQILARKSEYPFLNSLQFCIHYE